MSGRTVLLLVAGLIAAFTAISVKNRLSQSPVEQVHSTRVVVAKHDLAAGTFVQGASDLDFDNIPVPAAATPSTDTNAGETNAGETTQPEQENYLHEGAVKLSDFNGAVVRRTLHAGEPVPATALMKAGEGGFMSAVLNPGMRAVSIGVNATSGNAGFISPGDHVDLIVTHRIKAHVDQNNNDESVVSETFVRNVRVVAVDQMLDNPDNKAILAKTVTVEVSPRQAEQVSVAAEMGKISMALCSLAPAEAKPQPKPVENETTHTLTDLYGNTAPDANAPDTGYTRDSDISTLLEHKGILVPHVRVIRGDQTQNLEFYQGGQ